MCFIIDKELKFNDHIEFICKEIGEKNRIFQRHNKYNVNYNINKYLQYDNETSFRMWINNTIFELFRSTNNKTTEVTK